MVVNKYLVKQIHNLILVKTRQFIDKNLIIDHKTSTLISIEISKFKLTQVPTIYRSGRGPLPPPSRAGSAQCKCCRHFLGFNVDFVQNYANSMSIDKEFKVIL